MRGTWQQGPVEWIEFPDPEDEDHRYRVNVSFLMGSWHCLFGRGCPSLLNVAEDYAMGCCERGVTLSAEDVQNLPQWVDQMTEQDADNIAHIREKGWFTTNRGVVAKTRKLGDRCIFANRVNGPANAPGCAFHVLANRLGVSHIKTKPEICWAVPLWIKDHQDYSTTHPVLTTTVSGVDADTWGGGEDQDGQRGHMGYWCMDTPDAYLGNRPPLVLRMDEELRAMLGDKIVDRILELLVDKGYLTPAENGGYRRGGNLPVPSPGAVRNGGRPMLPLLIQEFRDYAATTVDQAPKKVKRQMEQSWATGSPSGSRSTTPPSGTTSTSTPGTSKTERTTSSA